MENSGLLPVSDLVRFIANSCSAQCDCCNGIAIEQGRNQMLGIIRGAIPIPPRESALDNADYCG